MTDKKIEMLEQLDDDLYEEMSNHTYSENEAIAMNIAQNAIAIVKEYIKWRSDPSAFSGIGYAAEKSKEIQLLLAGLKRNIEIQKGL